jgi:hypothetical protein
LSSPSSSFFFFLQCWGWNQEPCAC